ncbi:hypothetical protein BGW36DRAFT_454486 [Talaromyces proteolyticus]|uniref:Uncharacterized protein n=1 Tax=Talaromyces proteolyticus TaxID=1131652 RepID=A0AAD4KJR0_9EURO|nr:uncharacterized protein BGW36DRAFT_454486 [Talaromyces proteolyticus]KAH8693990.1 hypothetical protein BGW36DRAFT_454486 [Talaromyces proteolyticus]
MSISVDVLDAFNGKLFFKTAWEYNLEDVEKFIDDVVNDMQGHGVQEKWKSAVKEIQDYIINMKPRHPDEAAQSPRYYPNPPQYVYRKEDTETDPPYELDPKTVTNHQVYGMYDFIGFFFSLACAPTDADTENFFAPWLVIYWKWSKLFHVTLEEKKDTKKLSLDWKPLKLPTMLQCTWREVTKGSKEKADAKEIVFHMGASVGGHAHKEKPFAEYGRVSKQKWTQSIVQFRFNLLADLGQPTINGEYRFMEAPLYSLTAEEKKLPEERKEYLKKTKEKEGWDFGNCAETYPFLEIFSNQGQGQTIGVKYGGVAIKPDAMKKVMAKYENYKTPIITPPCENCSYLLDSKYGCGTFNFLPPQVEASSPPPPAPSPSS